MGLDEDSVFQTYRSDDIVVTPCIIVKQKSAVTCFAEAYIDGREFNIALMATVRGVQILPPAEMLFLDYPPGKLKLLDYRAKWVEDSFEYDNTRRTLDIGPQDDSLDRSPDATLPWRCWNLFGLRGYARVDFRVDQQGNPFVLEINANPCLSPDAGFAAALEQASISLS